VYETELDRQSCREGRNKRLYLWARKLPSSCVGLGSREPGNRRDPPAPKSRANLRGARGGANPSQTLAVAVFLRRARKRNDGFAMQMRIVRCTRPLALQRRRRPGSIRVLLADPRWEPGRYVSLRSQEFGGVVDEEKRRTSRLDG
jgi:hypothetical protein